MCAARGISGMPPGRYPLCSLGPRRRDAGGACHHLPRRGRRRLVQARARERSSGCFPGFSLILSSSISAYADFSSPGGSPANTPLLKPAGNPDEVDMENYGACQGCMRECRRRDIESRHYSPGLISGPGDQSNRFTRIGLRDLPRHLPIRSRI